jgi:spore germination cell wall hydrolase CwlJ-like protein
MPILLIILTSFIILFSVSKYEVEPRKIEVTYSDLIPKAQKEVRCLTQNIYFEAGNEPIEGKIAVAMVTLNRVNAKEWPNTICEVVKEKKIKKQKNKMVCQFSWWCENRHKEKAILGNYSNQEKRLYEKAKKVAVEVFINYDDMKETDISKGAYFYHADYIEPNWKLTKTTKIGKHIFYKK